MRTKTTLLNTLGVAILALSLAACKKSTPPTVTISNNISVTQTSANVTGEVTDEGSSSVTERGYIYGKQSESRQDTMYCGSGAGEFPTRLTGLEPNTTYNCFAFARNDGGIGTSGKVTFTTRDHDLPIVTTSEVENVGTTTASCGGNVMDDGGAEVIERGVCWSTNHSPTIGESHSTSGNGLGEYSCNMNNLAANTTYYVRAYAKNVKGVAYGDEKSFQTQDFDLPEVTTTNVTDITQTSANGGGEVTSDGGTMVTERGICWSTSHTPTVSGSHANSGTGTGSFTCNMNNLNAHTTYYVRAYATNSRGTAYGEEVSFNTSANKPTVSTGSVSSITTSSATGSGNVTSDGGSTVTERGICWSTHHEPTISGTHIAAGEGTGEFTATIANLSTNTTYYVRAYATNGVGTSYGDEVDFTTLSISVPGVTTANVTNIGNTTATGGGNVISTGGATVTERGICWGTSHNPTISGSHDSNGTGTGNYTVNMTGLTPNTTYYVKAYAINSQGTAYGEEVNFKTAQIVNYTVSVSANPSNGGTVSGGGTYQQGQSCTVHATAATGYTFQRWTENGSQVSTNANYTFTVTSNRSLVAHFNYNPQAPTGAINGLFSVSATQQVWFSQGNLQFNAAQGSHQCADGTTQQGTWRFATNQWDYVGGTDLNGNFHGNVSGCNNNSISSTYSGLIDLFGWGTSGWNCGNTYYRPWDYLGGASSYGPLGSYNLVDNYANSDWGYFNAINNGGNMAHQWRTLTENEWEYVLYSRSTTSGIRYVKAKVNNVKGVVLLPDNWNTNTYTLYNANQGEASFNSNVISLSSWNNNLQAHGAVFLPAAGDRYDQDFVEYDMGFYYSSTAFDNENGWRLQFGEDHLWMNAVMRSAGMSVRLVCPAN